MTHSLHRQGSIQDLKKDYVILAMLAAGFNDKKPDSREKLLKVAEILNKNNPSNIMPKFAWKISSVITAVYDDNEKVMHAVSELKKENLGVSIVVSGLIDDVKEILKDADLGMHTIHLSLGVFGKKELLPKEEKVLEMTTMCGHHCISPQSIDYYVNLIKKQKISIENAVNKLAKPCICGIFNTSRAKEKLTLLSNDKS